MSDPIDLSVLVWVEAATGAALLAYVLGCVAQLGEGGASTGRLMHEHVCGTHAVPAGRDDVENALIAVAVDAYPAYLLSPDPEHMSMPMMEKASMRDKIGRAHV